MKYIVKGLEPAEFTNWKNQANEDWIPSFSKLSGNVKKAIYDSLTTEQGFICCYCERELKNNDYHIEHLNPQEKNIVNPLDFSNMLCSCQRELKKAEPRHCGNSKGSWYQEDNFISPLDTDCEKKFKYTFDGHIEPENKNDVAAKTTIEKLNLYIDKLNKLRAKAIEPFVDDALSDKDLSVLVNGYLSNNEDNNGMYNEFYTTIKYLFLS